MHKSFTPVLSLAAALTLGVSISAFAPTSLAAGPDLSAVPAGTYSVDKEHAYITFSYDHQGYSKPFLRFRSLDSTLELEPADLAKSSVSVVIDTNSIDSGVDVFDGHLRGDGFFDVEKFPSATFKSTSFTPSATGGTMLGDLTLKGITKPVTLDVTFNKAGENMRSKAAQVGFSARGKIMRSDWDLGKYAPVVGDEVSLIIETEFQMAK